MLAAANLTTFNQDALADNDWVTSSISPTSNALILVAITVAVNTGVQPTTPSVSGNGITYELVDATNGKIDWDSSSGSRRTTFLFRGMAVSPSSGAITIDWGVQTSLRGSVNVSEVTGCTTGNNGADAIVQVAKNTNEGSPTSSLTVTLSAFDSANNGAYGVFSENNTYTASAGSGFSLVGSQVGTNETTACEFKASNDTSVDMSYTEGVTQAGAIAIEIEEAVIAGIASKRLLVGVGA